MKLKLSEKGYIEELSYQGNNIIYPWGIESGDSASFFSLTDKGWRIKVKELHKTISDECIDRKLEIKTVEGKWQLDYQDIIIDENTLKRRAEIHCVDESWFMDFVIRYRFKKNFIKYVNINGQKLYHRNSNKYHQYNVNKIELVGHQFSINVKLDDCITADKFYPVMYARDYRDEWIIHCRLLPSVRDKEILKINNRWYNKAIPQYFSNLLLKSTRLKEMTWYRSERSPYPRWNILFKYFLNLNGYDMVKVGMNSKFGIKSTFCLKPND